MDKSAEPSQTNKGFEDQIAEMSNSAPGSIADPTFDWHDFRDFLLNEENFDIILNALQKDAVAQSVLNKQQVHNKIHKGLTEFTRVQNEVQCDGTLWIQRNIYLLTFLEQV